MGEVEQDQVRLTAGWRQRLAGWLVPDYVDQLRKLEDQAYDTALKLRRATQQIRGLTRDTGQYTDRWVNLVSGDYNPDEVTYAEYKKMLNYDGQIIAGNDLIMMGVMMKPWKITHTDQEIVETITRALGSMEYPTIRNAMKEMLKAVPYGFTATEVVFDDYKGKYWMPRMKNGLKTFDPENIRFFSDEFGNLEKVVQYGMIPSRGTLLDVTGIVLPLDRTIIWTHEKEWGNWYGKPLLKGCYKNWFIKDAMLKFANIAYERFGSPVLLGVAASLQDMTNVQDAITHLYARSQAVIRKTDERDPTDIKVIESKRTEMPFDRYIRYHDEMILRRMLIGQRIFEGGGGTYGPKVPLDIIFMRLEDFRQELIDAMNHLLKMIVDLNWVVDDYPKFEFAPLTTMDQQQIVRTLLDMIDREIVEKDEDWIRPHLGFPAKTGGADTSQKEEENGEAED